MELKGKKVIVIGERDGVPGDAMAACVRAAGGQVVLETTECFVWTAAGAMDLDDQRQIKEVVDRFGTTELVVLLGAGDAESAAIAAETVTSGDPSYAGALAGMALGLPVYHILEPQVKGQIDPQVFDERVGFLEMALEAGRISESLDRIRAKVSS